MTPAQVAAVEETFALVDLDALADDFYRLAFAADPALLSMFVSDPGEQRDRFATELQEIVASIRTLETFEARVRTLGLRHRGYGVRSGHYRVMGDALIAALRDAIGVAWNPEVEEAWRLAYNLTAETMMLGAMGEEPSTRRR
jgi:hemoglobin-like flavoprotein